MRHVPMYELKYAAITNKYLDTLQKLSLLTSYIKMSQGFAFWITVLLLLYYWITVSKNPAAPPHPPPLHKQPFLSPSDIPLVKIITFCMSVHLKIQCFENLIQDTVCRYRTSCETAQQGFSLTTKGLHIHSIHLQKEMTVSLKCHLALTFRRTSYP